VVAGWRVRAGVGVNMHRPCPHCGSETTAHAFDCPGQPPRTARVAIGKPRRIEPIEIDWKDIKAQLWVREVFERTTLDGS